MEHRLSHSAAVVEPLRVALYPRPGQVFGADVIAHGGRVDDAPHELQPLDHDAAIVLGSEVVVADGGRGGRVPATDMYRAARLDLELRHGAGEAGVPVQDPAALGSREIDEVELRVGPLQLRPGADERGSMAGAYCQGSLLEQEVPQTHERHAPQAHHVVVQSNSLGTAPERAHVEMVLQIRADAGRLVHDRNAVPLEQRSRTDARQLEKLRRVKRAAAKNDLSCADRMKLAFFLKLDSDRTAIRKADPGRESIDLDLQVRPLLRRPQVADRSAAAAAFGRRRLVIAGALLHGTVEVVVARNAERHRGGDEGVAQLVARQVRYRERSTDAMPGVRAAALVLRLLEVRQEIVETPAGDRPAVEVLALTADIDQAVDRGGAAEHFAARREDAPAVQRRLGLGLVRPVEVGAREQLAVAERHVDPEIGVARPGFE